MHARLELASRRTRAWLAGMLGARVPLSLASHLDLIALADVCSFSNDDGTGRIFLHSAAVNFADSFDARPSGAAFGELLATDARRVLLAYRALQHAEVPCAHVDAFVGGLASSLAPVDPAPAEVAEICHLCRVSGLLAPTPGPPGDGAAVVLPSVVDLLGADDVAIQRICDDVGQVTRFGIDEAGLPADARATLAEVIPAWLLDFARCYKLTSLASALRTLTYAGGAGTEAAEEGVRFLFDQQNPSGWFGFFGPELARIRRQGRPFDAIGELYLPTTLACQWTLLESTGADRFLSPRPVFARSDETRRSA